MVKTSKRGIGELRSELIASHIGQTCGIPVQETRFCTIPQHKLLGLDGSEGICARFVVKRQEGRREEMIHGAQLLSDALKPYREFAHQKRPRIYNLKNIRKALLAYGKKKHALSDVIEGFFTMVCFDALIGGTDRHHWNWAVIEEEGKFLHFSPLFDNGVSLLWDLENLDVRRKLLSNSAFSQLVTRARSGIRLTEDRKGSLYETVKMVAKWPEVKEETIYKVFSAIGDLSKAKMRHAIVDRIPQSVAFGTDKPEVLGWVYKYVELRHFRLLSVLESLCPLSFSWNP